MNLSPVCICTIFTSTTQDSKPELSLETLVLPEHPDWIDADSQKAYIFGTAPTNLVPAGYWRTAHPVCTRTITSRRTPSAMDQPDLVYPGFSLDGGNTISHLKGISETGYNAKSVTNTYTGTTSVTVDENEDLNQFIITDIVYEDSNVEAEIANLDAAHPQKNAFFKYGQCDGVAYGFQCKWQQSLDSGIYSYGSIYTSALVGNIQGQITGIRVYITQRRYALSVTQVGGTITEPIFLTATNGDPLYIYDADGGAVARFGIEEIEAIRIDSQADTCGDLIDTSGTGAGEIQIGITDHDEILEVEGVTCYPMYGADGSNKESGVNGEASNYELGISLLSSDFLTEEDLIDGVWQNAKSQAYYVDWTTGDILHKEPPGYIGKIEIDYDNFSAYGAKLSAESGMARLKQKNTDLLQKGCGKDFGSPGCGVNLYSGGHIDNLVVTAVVDDYTIEVDSTQTEDNYYGVIYWQFNNKTRALNVAAYNGTTKQITFWQGINPNTLTVGTAIEAIRRCNKTEADCKKYQGNILQHGGAEKMPTDADVTKSR